MTDVVGAFFRGEKGEGASDDVPESVDGSGLGLPEQLLELGEGHFDRIEVWAIGRQKQQSCARVGDERRRLLVLMAGQIVEDHCVARAKCGDEDLLYIGQEALGVDRPVEHKGGNQPLAGQTGKERRRLPMPARGMAESACADIGPGMTACHRRRRPGLVEEDQATAKTVLRPPPCFPALSDVGAILFAGAHGFF